MTTDFSSRYGLNPAHSEVIEACKVIEPCKTLDMGCSNGRNALYLSQKEFKVTAVDNNSSAIKMLQDIIDEEKLTNIKAEIYDINRASLDTDYGFISCTVTLMFLDPTRIDAVIANMKERTLFNGYNLIVCAMNTEEYPCQINFPFTLSEGQLLDAYEGWELIKYNEEVGTMHNGAQLQFATILAQKHA